MLDKEQMGEIIAKNIAALLKDNSVVNLGVGLPTQVAYYVKPEQGIILQAENGLVGSAGDTKPGEAFDPDVISSSGYPTHIIKGAAFFDSTMAFGIIRGGHVDATVLGTLEVDEKGNIANYAIPGKLIKGMGGAMDLCVGAKEVIIATYHTNKGRPKLLKECRIPLTAERAANVIVTEKAVIRVTERGFLLTAYNPMFTIEDIAEGVEAKLLISEDLKEMLI